MKNNNPKKKDRALSPAVKNFNWLLLAKVIGAALVSSVIFFLGISGSELWFKLTYLVYAIALGGFIIAYFVINRGFTERGITADMLPDTMSPEEKSDYVEKSLKREKDSRWMLIVIIALALPISIDLFRLFAWDRFFGD